MEPSEEPEQNVGGRVDWHTSHAQMPTGNSICQWLKGTPPCCTWDQFNLRSGYHESKEHTEDRTVSSCPVQLAHAQSRDTVLQHLSD
ncbi:hypothetical protein M8J77_008388 [Diaphorina citri]|nr:hypothetical protein M8J77_008388 [Diaphorina citri]